MDQERLSKVMAARGLCSRREADKYIERGHVSVNGIIVNKLAVKFHQMINSIKQAG